MLWISWHCLFGNLPTVLGAAVMCSQSLLFYRLGPVLLPHLPLMGQVLKLWLSCSPSAELLLIYQCLEWTQYSKCSVMTDDDNHFPGSTAYALVNTIQDTFGLLCCQCTLLSCSAYCGNLPQVLFCRAVSQAACPQPALCPKVLPSQTQSFAFVLDKFCKNPVSMFRSPWRAALSSVHQLVPSN